VTKRVLLVSNFRRLLRVFKYHVADYSTYYSSIATNATAQLVVAAPRYPQPDTVSLNLQKLQLVMRDDTVLV